MKQSSDTNPVDTNERWSTKLTERVLDPANSVTAANPKHVIMKLYVTEFKSDNRWVPYGSLQFTREGAERTLKIRRNRLAMYTWRIGIWERCEEL